MAHSLATAAPCEAVIGAVRPWLSALLASAYGLGLKDSLTSRRIDHMCYRCGTREEYINVRSRLTQDSIIGELVVEGMIGGRPISTIKLVQPFEFEEWSIPAIEVTCPKPGKQHKVGLEHIEVVIGTESDSFLDSKLLLSQYQQQHPQIAFDTKAFDKEINADISVDLGADLGSIKFHARPLLDVCMYEMNHGMVEAVPVGYFDS